MPDAVDFRPFRSGIQSDPNTGEFAIADVPGPVNDAAPTVTLSTDKLTYKHGEKVTLTAAPADDFGVKEVVFYDGAWQVGAVAKKPYKATYTIPWDVTCSQRTLTNPRRCRSRSKPIRTCSSSLCSMPGSRSTPSTRAPSRAIENAMVRPGSGMAGG